MALPKIETLDEGKKGSTQWRDEKGRFTRTIASDISSRNSIPKQNYRYQMTGENISATISSPIKSASIKTPQNKPQTENTNQSSNNSTSSSTNSDLIESLKSPLSSIKNFAQEIASNIESLQSPLSSIENFAQEIASNTDKLVTDSIITKLTLKEMLTSINAVAKRLNVKTGGGAGESEEDTGSRRSRRSSRRRSSSSGGMLSNIGDWFKNTTGFGELIGSLGSLFKGLTKLIRFAGPIGLVVGALAMVDKGDWLKVFDNLKKLFDDLANGEYLKAVLRAVGSIADLVKGAVKTLLTNILSWIGFDDAAKKVKSFLESFSFSDLLLKGLEFIKNIPDKIAEMASGVKKYIQNIDIKNLVDKVKEIFMYIPNKLAEIGSAIKGFLNKLSPSNILKSITNYIADTPLGRSLGFKRKSENNEAADNPLGSTPEKTTDARIAKALEEQKSMRESFLTSGFKSRREKSLEIFRWNMAPGIGAVKGANVLAKTGGAFSTALATPGITAKNIQSGRVSIKPTSSNPIVVKGGDTINNYGSQGVGGIINTGGASSRINTSQVGKFDFQLYGRPGLVPSNN